MRLDVSGLSFSYGAGVQALSNVSMHVAPGEVVGLVGPNGSGKSTLIKNVFDLVKLQRGVVSVDGHSHVTSAARRAAVHLSSNDFLPQFLTGREFVGLFARMYGVGLDASTLESLAFDFSLLGWLDRLVEDYSHGMRKKLQILAALAVDRPLTVVDETLNGIDLEASRLCESLFGELRERDRSVLLCSHDFTVLERLADRVVFLDLGRVVTEGTTEELTAQHGSLSNMVFGHLESRAGA